jgi:hypothetical protein
MQFQPAAANVSAMAFPKPDVAPVTKIVLLICCKINQSIRI